MKRLLLILVLGIATTLSALGQTYTLCDKWVDCGNSGQLLDPYYSEGVTIKWNGNLKNDKADGFGTAIKYKNGKYESTYEGEYKNGIREGKGKFTHADGSVKTGTFVNGQLTGRGIAETEDGHRYDGEFINYRMHGKGKIEYANGASFDGYLVADNRTVLNINGEDVSDMRRIRYDGGFCILSAINNGYDMAYVDAAELNLYEFVEDESAIREYIPSHRGNSNDWVSSGSGFFIDECGYIATNYHVVDGATTIEVAFIRNGKTEKYPASVVLSDKQNDLSIIKIENPDFRPMPAIPYNFTTNIKDPGSEVFTLGYPIADVMGEEVKFTDGKISSRTGIQDDVTVYQISVPIQPVNSGGPLFDTHGNLVGITSSGLNRDYFKSENVNYAIKSSYLQSLIDAMPQNLTLRTQSDLGNLPLTEMIKRFQPYMVYIKVK